MAARWGGHCRRYFQPIFDSSLCQRSGRHVYGGGDWFGWGCDLGSHRFAVSGSSCHYVDLARWRLPVRYESRSRGRRYGHGSDISVEKRRGGLARGHGCHLLDRRPDSGVSWDLHRGRQQRDGDCDLRADRARRQAGLRHLAGAVLVG